jgi:hypothetical protein
MRDTAGRTTVPGDGGTDGLQTDRVNFVGPIMKKCNEERS